MATTQNVELIEEVEKNSIEMNELEFNSFQSCEDMTNVLEDYIKDNFKDSWWRRGYYPELFFDDVALEDSSADVSWIALPQANLAKSEAAATGWWTDLEYSSTNIQVTGVDEADIIKSNGKNLYYYNQKEGKIHILSTPAWSWTNQIDLQKTINVSDIILPNNFNGIQLYIQNDKLIILANRWNQYAQQGFLNNGSQVDVIVYNVSTPSQPKLERFTEFDGYYHDSRMIWDKLYLVNQLWFNRYWPAQTFEDVNDIELDADEIRPRNIDISVSSSEANLEIDGETYPFRVSINKPSCEDIYYTLPSKESIDNLWLQPQFTTVNVIDISNTSDLPETNVAFWNTQTIHMSKENIYLTSGIYLPNGNSFVCPPNARCITPFFANGQNTLIHKFNLKNLWIWYQDSALVNWAPLTQYSMDESADGDFRILTKTRHPELATDLYILDKNLDLVGSLEDIEPGEEFKSSRYMWDKLYLVTFERIDPLFAIDLEDKKNPRILWELKIPWFSTYLHPYQPLADNKQLLLWLWYDTDLNERWWTVQEGIKLDLYEVDYTNKDIQCITEPCPWVTVKQLRTKTWGERWSSSEATHNPRMFVRNESDKTLLLPLHLMWVESNQQRCESERDVEGNIIREECWNDERSTTNFLWYKAISVYPDSWIEEVKSFDYKELFQQDKDIYNNGWYNTRLLWQRVGYIWDTVYNLNGAFWHFSTLSHDNQKEAYIPFSDQIKFIKEEPHVSYSADEAWTSLCLNNAWWKLFINNDCRYCAAQEDVFWDYYAKVNKVNCSRIENQQTCSDNWVTWYPTWVKNWDEETKLTWLQSIEKLYKAAECG